MGLDYISKQKKEFHVNVSGADVLGNVHFCLGLPSSAVRRSGPPYRVPYSADADKAISMAAGIDAASDEQIIAANIPEFCDDTDEEFVAWIREWADFLRDSQGYSTET